MTMVTDDSILLEVGPLNKAFGTSTVLRDVRLSVRTGNS